MFDVTAKVGVSISSMSFTHTPATNITLDIYTAVGSYSGQYSNPSVWTLLDSTSYSSFESPRLLSIPIPPIEIQAGSTQSFYVVTSGDPNGRIYCGSLPADVVADDQVEIRPPARVFPYSEPFANPSFDSFSFQGGIIYSATAVSDQTAFPSVAPTISDAPSVSLQPTKTGSPSTSFRPTIHTSDAPSVSFIPTVKKSEVPSQSPISTSQWYMNWDVLRCRQDCNGKLPCGGNAKHYMTLYDTAQACCAGSFRSSHLLADQCEDLSLR